jgi:hypothetical protein
MENKGASEAHSFGDVTLPQDQRSNVTLTLYRVPGQGAADIFTRIFDDKILDTHRPDQKAEFSRILIGLIDRQTISS